LIDRKSNETTDELVNKFTNISLHAFRIYTTLLPDVRSFLMLGTFLKAAFPHVSQSLIEATSSELTRALSRPDTVVLTEEIDSLKRDLAAAEDEILRLKQDAISFRLGVKNATRGGLEMLAERARHLSEEGFTDQQDDALDDVSLIAKAMAYLQDVMLREQGLPGFQDTPPDYWPGKLEEWKPKREILRQIRVAGSILIAAADRKYRLGIQHL
jgi:cell division protein FtsB